MPDPTPLTPTPDQVRHATRTLAALAAYLRTYPSFTDALPLLVPVLDEREGVPVHLGDALLAFYRIATDEPGLPRSRDRSSTLASLRESEQILADWDAYCEEHTDLDGWPLDDVAYGRRAAQRDADTWRSFNRVRSFAKNLLTTAEVQVQQLNAAHLQSRWPWQLATLDYALKQLDALQQKWLDARDALPPTARPATPAYDDALTERNAEAWSSLDDWAGHGKALLEIQATAQDLPPHSPAPALTVKAHPRSAALGAAPVARR